MLECLARHAPGTPALVLGIPDEFMEHGEVAEQWRLAGIDAASVAERTRSWLGGSK